MNQSLANISLRIFRKYLQHCGCQRQRGKGGHEKWIKPGLSRPIILRFTDFLIYPEGLQWWADNGASVNLEFDLETNRLSQVVLLEYLKYKGIVL